MPKTNQVADFKRHLELWKKAEAAAERGHALLAAGDLKGAEEALAEADECMEERFLLEERWKR